MRIAVSFDRDSASSVYQLLIERFETPDTAVYGNNLTHFFPRGPRDFRDYERMDVALRHPDLIIVLLSREYLDRDWMRSELEAFLRLEDARGDPGLVLVIPTGDVQISQISKFYQDAMKPGIELRTCDDSEIEALSSYIAERRACVASSQSVQSKKVFIVHGHDHHGKNELEIFLREIGLDPVVVHREAESGNTLIEKIERLSDVSYALILMTPDDVCHPVSPEESGQLTPEYRPRQNVIFEFGYFVGKLSRKRVCCIHRKGVTLPTDVSGMVYMQFKDHIDEIKYKLLQELKSAGFILQN